MVPYRLLRHLDLGFQAISDTHAGVRTAASPTIGGHKAADRCWAPDACRTCGRQTSPTNCGHLCWCSRCRSCHFPGDHRLLCHVPDAWSPHAFVRYWGRALCAMRTARRDLTFTRYFSARFAINVGAQCRARRSAKCQPIRLGQFAVEHELLSPDEVDWILQLQRTTPPRRRRYFGEIAIELGLWHPRLLAPLLAAQAERTRGLVPHLVQAVALDKRALVEAERDFFGISAHRDCLESCPITSLLAH